MGAPLHPPLPFGASDDQKNETYARVRASIDALLEDETDWVSAMSTVVCELHHAFGYFHWTGFYRTIAPELLAVGPYQGGHGCLRIPFAKGVCGAAARTRETQLVPDVEAFPGHIACSSSTRSEIVVPLVGPARRARGARRRLRRSCRLRRHRSRAPRVPLPRPRHPLRLSRSALAAVLAGEDDAAVDEDLVARHEGGLREVDDGLCDVFGGAEAPYERA